MYFAYGSNLNWDQMKMRCPDCHPVTKATLKEWKLQFRGPLDIEPDTESEVQGVVFSISENDLKNLDAYEGFPTCYTRKIVALVNNRKNQLIRATIYVMTKTRKGRDLWKPSRKYLQCVLQGHSDFDIPDNQVWKALNRINKF